MSEAIAQPVSATPAQSATQQDGSDGSAASFTPEQTAIYAEVDTLRAQAMDLSRPKGERDTLIQKIADLQREARNGEKAAWRETPKAYSTQEHDPMAAALGDGLEKSLRPEEVETLRSSGVIRGLHPSAADAVAKLVGNFSMPRQIASAFMDRVLRHAGAEHDFHALTAEQAFSPLDAAQTEEYRAEASRLCGSSQRFEALRAEVSGLLKSHGLGDGIMRTSLGHDPYLLGIFRLWLSTAPARA